MPGKLSKSNQSVEKTLRLIEALADAREPMRLNDLSQRCGMPASTTLRMVNTLVEQGYAYQEAQTLRYGLTLRFARIGHQIVERFDIRAVAHPYLAALSQRYGESTCLAIEEDGAVSYLDVVEGTRNMINIRQRVGKSAPMHATGSGKLMLAQYSPAQLQAFAARRGLERLTPRTLCTLEALAGELETVRRQGYAIDDEECETGMRCLAVPVRDYQGRVAALSLSAPVMRLTPEHIAQILPALTAAARDISRKLAGEDRDEGGAESS